MQQLFIKTYITISVTVLFVMTLLVLASPQVGATCSPPSGNGSITSSVSIPQDGTYRVWSRMKASSSTNNSYMLEINGTCYTVGDTDVPTTNWKWVDYRSGNTGTKIDHAFDAGNQTIKLFGNAKDVQVDRLIFALDDSCTPTDKGDNCTNQSDPEGSSGENGGSLSDESSSGGSASGSNAGSAGEGTTTGNQSATQKAGEILQNLTPAAIAENVQQSVQKVATVAKKNPAAAAVVGVVSIGALSGLGYLAYAYKPWQPLIRRFKSFGVASSIAPAGSPKSTPGPHESVIIHPENKR